MHEINQSRTDIVMYQLQLEHELELGLGPTVWLITTTDLIWPQRSHNHNWPQRLLQNYSTEKKFRDRVVRNSKQNLVDEGVL